MYTELWKTQPVRASGNNAVPDATEQFTASVTNLRENHFSVDGERARPATRTPSPRDLSDSIGPEVLRTPAQVNADQQRAVSAPVQESSLAGKAELLRSESAPIAMPQRSLRRASETGWRGHNKGHTWRMAPDAQGVFHIDAAHNQVSAATAKPVANPVSPPKGPLLGQDPNYQPISIGDTETVDWGVTVRQIGPRNARKLYQEIMPTVVIPDPALGAEEIKVSFPLPAQQQGPQAVLKAPDSRWQADVQPRQKVATAAQQLAVQRQLAVQEFAARREAELAQLKVLAEIDVHNGPHEGQQQYQGPHRNGASRFAPEYTRREVENGGSPVKGGRRY